MKRLISAIVVAAMLLMLMSGTVFAAIGDTLKISADPVTAKAGETAIITLVVEENPGFVGMVFWPVIRDSKGEEVDWNRTPDMGNSALPFDMDAVSSILLSADDNCAETGILMDLLIHIPQDAASGEYTVIFMVEDCLAWTPDLNIIDVPVDLPAVTITVTSSGAVDCAHSDTASVAEKAPTCTESGLTEGQKCSTCGEVLVAQKEIPATGHSFGQWAVKTQPTTETEGVEVRICAGCGEEETRSIDKLPSEPKNDTLVIVVIVSVALLGIALAAIVLLKKKNA